MDWSKLLYGQLNNFDTSITTRGFTGHEMLDRVGLIHMNGRIYNPALGRFLQADPFVQEPGYSQSYNHYAYVWNNPLNATDSSGYFEMIHLTPNKNEWSRFIFVANGLRKGAKKVCDRRPVCRRAIVCSGQN